jgi:hypothetical protein
MRALALIKRKILLLMNIESLLRLGGPSNRVGGVKESFSRQPK